MLVEWQICVICVLLALLSSWVGVKGSVRAVNRRLGCIEDDLVTLDERFNRAQKSRAGVSAQENRARHMAEAEAIAAAAAGPKTIKLPGRASG